MPIVSLRRTSSFETIPSLQEAEAIVAELRADLYAQTLERGAAARSILRAAASLRFIADRFYIDRAYLDRSFAEN